MARLGEWLDEMIERFGLVNSVLIAWLIGMFITSTVLAVIG